MTDTFITKIQVRQARNIRDLTIPLSETERRHLIITGRNGSGKTSLLEELAGFLRQAERGRNQTYFNYLNQLKSSRDQLAVIETRPRTDSTGKQIAQSKANIEQLRNLLKGFGGTEISFTKFPSEMDREAKAGNFLIAFYEAKRQIQLTVPSGIQKLSLKKKYSLNESVSPVFLQYLVNLKAERSFARDDGDDEAARQIDDWFAGFQNRLRLLFQAPGLTLRFDRKRFDFEIMEEERKAPFGFNTLADGYSAILGIVTDLLLRMEGHGGGVSIGAYDLAGVVLIDEIETHLHVDLQKEVLPFLVDFFPRIQFIVTTHSPFVLSSVSNAVICDLEEGEVTEDLSAYSYDALVESYFEADKYSEAVKERLARYEALLAKDAPSKEEAEELGRLRAYFSSTPKYLSRELALKLQQLELQGPPRHAENGGGG
uniref:Predicted ATP-binding protein involved in virulence n=1 Tax=Candidatus Kentrum sp. FM TaxID=2126340 RepID=A0A450TN92_9GAMM|nr:MAG: Predicted ATP-binding protein involved in virulence [Candidatus Kentron sp. FM]VFJ70300.1 MAG: Predicted ATP-binding protein involved in virulence [Candidatus Kentron sp. FM]VFK15501.1 MAG: Predicted ATP-binding protein involved in virulence [Candidatus Kentron sp. FM]